MKFIVGNTYSTRSACDHNCVFQFTVVKRTAKFITITGGSLNDSSRVGVTIEDGGEIVFPHGRHSMAPVIRANRPD